MNRSNFRPIGSSILSVVTLVCVMSLGTGCKPESRPSVQPSIAVSQPPIRAQGKLLPASGILQVAAMPGDRVLELLVREGQSVTADQPLLRLQSEALRQREIELAKQKREEALEQLDAKRREADLAIELANLELEQTRLQLEQAQAQLSIVQRQEPLVQEAYQQVERWVQLSKDERTKGMVGTMDIQQKRLEAEQHQAKFDQSLLMAEQAVALAKLGMLAGQQKRDAALESRRLVDALAPTESLAMQIELLELQAQATRVVAASDGVVLSISTRPGELVAQFPLLELADLSAMVCIAEVSDLQVRHIRVGQAVEMKSTALEGTLHGTVERIDRVVGSPELKIPNPLAKSDFRAVPVRIRIAKEDTEMASQLVRLQVDVEIHVAPEVAMSNSNSEP